MKQTENNEIDLLLRGLARREGARSIASEDRALIHLDADELNSYAEQALPAAARARYTSHLAECASCRKIVSELASASGANVSKHSVPQKTSAGLLQKFGALFSPGLLRFAVPALALFAFIAVGLVVLRQQRQPDFVAQNQPTASRDATIETKKAFDSPTEPANSAAAIEERRATESQTSAAKGRDNQAKTGEKNETSTTTPTDSIVTSNSAVSPGKAAGGVASPSYAPEPAPPATPKPQTKESESRTEVAARQKEEADKKDEPAREQEGVRARRDGNQNEVARPQARTGSLAGQSQERLHKLEARPGSGAGAKTNDDEADNRTVSGRRFRRQGGIWIDTSFQSSMTTTTVARDSEQFRALVADEPGIRAIATQLTGEVVIVWKGRAYRIR